VWSAVHGAVSWAGLPPEQTKPGVFPLEGLQAPGNATQTFITLYFPWTSVEFFPSQSKQNCLTKAYRRRVADWGGATDTLCLLAEMELMWVTARLVFLL